MLNVEIYIQNLAAKIFVVGIIQIFNGYIETKEVT